jgi:hypothetical protein
VTKRYVRLLGSFLHPARVRLLDHIGWAIRGGGGIPCTGVSLSGGGRTMLPGRNGSRWGNKRDQLEEDEDAGML